MIHNWWRLSTMDWLSQEVKLGKSWLWRNVWMFGWWITDNAWVGTRWRQQLSGPAHRWWTSRPPSNIQLYIFLYTLQRVTYIYSQGLHPCWSSFGDPLPRTICLASTYPYLSLRNNSTSSKSSHRSLVPIAAGSSLPPLFPFCWYFPVACEPTIKGLYLPKMAH